jgi:hypothetical protein
VVIKSPRTSRKKRFSGKKKKTIPLSSVNKKKAKKGKQITL